MIDDDVYILHVKRIAFKNLYWVPYLYKDVFGTGPDSFLLRNDSNQNQFIKLFDSFVEIFQIQLKWEEIESESLKTPILSFHSPRSKSWNISDFCSLVIIDFILKNIIKLKIISYYTHTSKSAPGAGCLPHRGISNLEPGFKKLVGGFGGGWFLILYCSDKNCSCAYKIRYCSDKNRYSLSKIW
jgi:hypothetical protein